MKVDFLVIGSGIAGLSFALKASRIGTVVIVTKKKEVDTATNLAQGGIAAVLGENDDFSYHINDTLKAGAGLCVRDVVEMVVKSGPERIEELMEIGVNFVKEGGCLDLGREGGHSKRRVAHSYDLTGKEIERALLGNVSKSENITMFENQMCVDVVTTETENNKKVCQGAKVLDLLGNVQVINSKITVLCTGGAGKVYLYTSNPDIATGDGVAIGHRAGAKVKNLEFVQFHPTCLYHHTAKNFLISEAVRGEGGVLINEKKERFMSNYEPKDMELATRDKVARAIDDEMKKSGADCVYLDIRHKGEAFLRNRFPTIYDKCKSLGLDISKQAIPVVPAAHYLCGGLVTDKNGRTNINNMYALGETAYTGLHGGNRLASNSLLEAVVFADNAYQYIKKNWYNISHENYPEKLEKNMNGKKNKLDEEILINHNWDIIRRIMWNYVGIVRRVSRLEIARMRIEEVKREINDIIDTYEVTPNMMELRNISLVAALIIEACLERKESKGLHYIEEK